VADSMTLERTYLGRPARACADFFARMFPHAFRTALESRQRRSFFKCSSEKRPRVLGGRSRSDRIPLLLGRDAGVGGSLRTRTPAAAEEATVEADRVGCGREPIAVDRNHAEGRMFWLTRNRLAGSNFCFSATSRSKLSP
jgi:hypothetical protein